MCNPISAVLTKQNVLFAVTDRHEDIINTHRLHEGIGRINFARVELSAPGGDFRLPIKLWVYRLDQDKLPPWYDAARDEARLRGAVERSGIGMLYAGYQAKIDSIDADYWAKLDSVDADYQAKRASINADYWAKLAPIEADYLAKRALIDADYQAKPALIDADYLIERTRIARIAW